MKKSKICFLIAIALVLVTILSGTVLAYNPSSITGTQTGNAFNKVKTVGQKVLGIVQVVGTLAAIITLIILGIKYMVGSAEEKAEYKKTLMPYLIGAIFVLGATNITSWIYTASQGFFS